MSGRSSLPEVRNPVLGVPGVRAALSRLSPQARAELRNVLLSIAVDARDRAEKSWRTHKAPMALYWKAVAVYSGHLARAINQVSRVDQLDLAA